MPRNNILQRGKQFTCSCVRCRDPTELGSLVSSLRCGQCQVELETKLMLWFPSGS